MTAVYCFSATGRTRRVAQYMARMLSCQISELSMAWRPDSYKVDTAVVVFPVYCQSIPLPVRKALPLISASDFILIAAYGRKSFGNALGEAVKLVKGRVIAGAYVPVGHTYLNEQLETDLSRLDPLLLRIANPKPIRIPTSWKNPFASFFPLQRGKLGVRITRGKNCDNCGLCTKLCPMHTMVDGKPGKSCIRCLRCVHICPQNALRATLHPCLKQYLNGKRKNDFWVY